MTRVPDATPHNLQAVLARYWGFPGLRPLQQEAIDAVLHDRDSLVVLPTGGGKSLCYQAPALMRPGMAVVVSPLLSLMKDQVDTLVANGVAAALYNSTLTGDEKSRVARGMRDGRFNLLYVSPERLVGDGSESFVTLLSQCDVSFLAIDEAHCISQWGHDFRPEYRQLRLLRDHLPGLPMHAYTATATRRVREDITHQLALRDPVELVGGFDRPNLVYRVVSRGAVKGQVAEVIARHRHEAGIVYCPSRRDVDALATWLAGEGIRALPYHAGLTDLERRNHQDAFLGEQADVMVATVAFGMGIDRPDVRFVFHTGAPRSVEHYQQESGRAGRDGLAAECVLAYSSADMMRWRIMLERSGESTDETLALMRRMDQYATGTACRHRYLAEYFGDTWRKDSCGACDVCLGELEEVADSARVGRQILSCVARVEQRFGIGHVATVLCGRATSRVTACGHDQLSTFGLLSHESVVDVRGYVEQLISAGLLRQVGDSYPLLALTPAGLAQLRDERNKAGVRLARRRPASKKIRAPRHATEPASWADADRALFEQLRSTRLEVARARGVPPYVIFHDATLREMVRIRPASRAELRTVKGVGERKSEDLGDEFLRVIQGT